MARYRAMVDDSTEGGAMNFARMQEIEGDLWAKLRGIRKTKGIEYAGEEDTLADFKEIAEEVGISPLQVWAVYVKKHERAIDSFIKMGGRKTLSEGIDSRVLDVVVYHALLLGLIEDLNDGNVEDAEIQNIELLEPLQ